jgi:enoyl-CoA hydratase/carnithine racemase
MVFTTVTRPHALVWQLTLSQPPDNRMTPDALHELQRRLDQIEADWRRTNAGKPPAEWQGGALIVTGGGPKFFSNGLDPETTKDPDFTSGV